MSASLGAGSGGTGLGGLIPQKGTVVGDVIRHPLGAIGTGFVPTILALESDQRAKILENLAGEGGRTASRTQSRAAQSATARGMTGGLAAASQDRAVGNVLQNLSAREAELSTQFLQQDIAALAAMAQLGVSAGMGGQGNIDPAVLAMIFRAAGGGRQGAGGTANAGASVGQSQAPVQQATSPVAASAQPATSAPIGRVPPGLVAAITPDVGTQLGEGTPSFEKALPTMSSEEIQNYIDWIVYIQRQQGGL